MFKTYIHNPSLRELLDTSDKKRNDARPSLGRSDGRATWRTPREYLVALHVRHRARHLLLCSACARLRVVLLKWHVCTSRPVHNNVSRVPGDAQDVSLILPTNLHRHVRARAVGVRLLRA